VLLRDHRYHAAVLLKVDCRLCLVGHIAYYVVTRNCESNSICHAPA
jgi:hypothetical protein